MMCQRQSSFTINSFTSKQAEIVYTSFLSSQSSLFSNSGEGCGHGDDYRLDASKHGSWPIHLDLLRSNFDFSEIFPLIELQVLAGSSTTTRAQKEASEEVKEIFSRTLETLFTGKSASARLVLLVQIYLSHDDKDRRRHPTTCSTTNKKKRKSSALSSIKVAYSVFNRETRKFLMAKEVLTTKRNDQPSQKKSYILSKLFIGHDDNKKKGQQTALKDKASIYAHTIVDEVSSLWWNNSGRFNEPFNIRNSV